MMCYTGLTAAEAARIGFGLGLLAMLGLAALVLCYEAWVAAGEPDGEPANPDAGRVREDLKLEVEEK